MAGWIKREVRLGHKAEIIRMAAILKPCKNFDHSRKVIAESCQQIWEWADDNVTEIDAEGTGRATIGPDPARTIDTQAGIPGFGDAMSTVGWLRIRDLSTGLIEFPNYDRHNGQNAKTRAKHAKLTQKRRSVRNGAHKERTREEKRRSKSSNDDLLPSWSLANGFVGIDEACRRNWECAYPDVDIDVELASAHSWLVANPAKSRKKNWAQFIRNWLTKSQRDASGHRPKRSAAEVESVLRECMNAAD